MTIAMGTPTTVRQLIAALGELDLDLEVIVVDDDGDRRPYHSRMNEFNAPRVRTRCDPDSPHPHYDTMEGEPPPEGWRCHYCGSSDPDANDVPSAVKSVYIGRMI